MAQDIGIICPVQPKPQMPQRAIDEDISGIVHARALIRDGAVKEVVLLDGPRVFYAAVKAAMLKYQCQAGPVGGVWAEQTFDFKEAEGN
jgi:protein TonB